MADQKQGEVPRHETFISRVFPNSRHLYQHQACQFPKQRIKPVHFEDRRFQNR